MAAMETFQEFLASMSDGDRARLDHSIRSHRADLFAARSEDARIRVTSGFIEEINELLGRKRRP